MSDKPFSVYAERNGGPILDVIRDEFATVKNVLEIGSGSGQHAAQFAAALPFLTWQTSDVLENHEGIVAWIDSEKHDNLLPPLPLDVRSAELPDAAYDAVFSANTAHIMSFDSVMRMFALVGKTLRDGGVFCLYGPFRQDGVFNAPSNASFHRTLRARNKAMGIRHLEELDSAGERNGLYRERLYAMPANNHIAVWRKRES